MAQAASMDFSQTFSPGDRIRTKTGKYFAIDEIGEDRIQFHLLATGRSLSLETSKLRHVIEHFDSIKSSNNLVLAVQEVLKKYEENETANESYLYGLAERFLEKRGAVRKSRAKGSIQNQTSLETARQKAEEQGDFDPRDLKDARKRRDTAIVLRQGQAKFRNKLMDAYNGRCAISDCDCPDALEAAHIFPYKGIHTNHIQNGILLRSDIHTLFDLGKIRISQNYRVTISRDIRSTVYREFHNKTLRLPTSEQDRPKFSDGAKVRKNA